MAERSGRKYLLLVGLCGLAALLLWVGRPTRGSQPETVVQRKTQPKKIYFGVLACSNGRKNGGCHDSPADANPNEISLCGFDEVRIWSEKDKHKDANTVLKGERGKQIANLLGIKGDISKEPSCISCHGVLIAKKDEKAIHDSFRLDEGVSCVVCHGAYEDWYDKHSSFLNRKAWRTLSRKTKEEEYGMTDLWDPDKRATLCVSCHIGNTTQGKVVTHAMYAAGHPPLPGIEVGTFSDAMPPHWKYFSEKKPEVQKLILDYDPAKADLERTQIVVVAGLVAFRESMNLLATQAEQEGGAADSEKHWPEFAQFDCYACHHDLKSPSWRQERGYVGKAGRPEMRAWSTALVDLGIGHASKGDPVEEMKHVNEMRHKMKDLTAAFDKQPFGEPKQVAKAARQLSQWTNGLLAEIKARPGSFDRSAAQRLVLELGKIAKNRLVDFDSARQLAWALRTIEKDLNPQVLEPKQSTAPARLLQKLDAQLSLDLPKGQVEISKDYLREWLRQSADYEPDQFRKTFEQLIESVKKPGK